MTERRSDGEIERQRDGEVIPGSIISFSLSLNPSVSPSLSSMISHLSNLDVSLSTRDRRLGSLDSLLVTCLKGSQHGLKENSLLLRRFGIKQKYSLIVCDR